VPSFRHLPISRHVFLRQPLFPACQPTARFAAQLALLSRVTTTFEPGHIFVAHLLLREKVTNNEGGKDMYHTIEFRLRGLAEFESPGGRHLEQIVIQQGSRFSAQTKPYVVESKQGPVEVADLLLEDGSLVRAVRMATFSFLDE